MLHSTGGWQGGPAIVQGRSGGSLLLHQSHLVLSHLLNKLMLLTDAALMPDSSPSSVVIVMHTMLLLSLPGIGSAVVKVMYHLLLLSLPSIGSAVVKVHRLILLLTLPGVPIAAVTVLHLILLLRLISPYLLIEDHVLIVLGPLHSIHFDNLKKRNLLCDKSKTND